MKNTLLFALFILLLASCNSQKKYSDFDISYMRSGGYAPVYENFLIKGNSVHYSFEGQGKKFKKDFTLTNDELSNIQNTLTENNFRTIQEDYKKVYDNISTSINVKTGPNAGSKTDASFIMAKDQKRWDNITAVFRNLIEKYTASTK